MACVALLWAARTDERVAPRVSVPPCSNSGTVARVATTLASSCCRHFPDSIEECRFWVFDLQRLAPGPAARVPKILFLLFFFIQGCRKHVLPTFLTHQLSHEIFSCSRVVASSTTLGSALRVDVFCGHIPLRGVLYGIIAIRYMRPRRILDIVRHGWNLVLPLCFSIRVLALGASLLPYFWGCST